MPDDKKGNKFSFDMGNRTALLMIAGLILLFLFFMSFARGGMNEISYSEFQMQLEAGNIVKVTILDMSEIQGTMYDSSNRMVSFSTVIPYFDDELLGELEAFGIREPCASRLGMEVHSWLN